MRLKILKLLRMTYDDISEFFGFEFGPWRKPDLKEGSRIPKNYRNYLKIWQMEFRMTSPSLFLYWISGRSKYSYN